MRRIPAAKKAAQQKRSCLDLFSGAGGFSEGFRQAGFHTIAACDIDPSAAATYQMNHARFGTKFVIGDITKKKVREEFLAAADQQEIDAIIGGPPCQAFSQVRNHDRIIGDPRNRLYREYVSILEQVRPRVFVMVACTRFG